MGDALSIPCSFMPLWLHQIGPFAWITLPRLPSLATSYSFIKTRFKFTNSKKLSVTPFSLFPLLWCSPPPVCFPCITMVCLLICLSPQGRGHFLFPLPGTLFGTQETMNKSINIFFKIKRKKQLQRQIWTSVLSESSFPSNSSSSSLPEPLEEPGWCLGISPGSSMLIVVASGFAAREVTTSPNSEIN